jgi:hypothetical protein
MVASFHADLRLLTTREGGRIAPVRSGYRALGCLEGAQLRWEVKVAFDSPTCLTPGDSGLVRITLWGALSSLTAGTVIHLYEGRRLVGTATLREWSRPDRRRRVSLERPPWQHRAPEEFGRIAIRPRDL